VSGFLFDTNIPSEMLRPRPNSNVTAWVERQTFQSLFISVITLGELRKGTALLVGQTLRKTELERLIDERLPDWFADRVLPVSVPIAERWGTLDAERQLAGRPLHVADGLIAATALEYNLTLVTRNVKDFAGLGVSLLNPWNLSASSTS
jgi:predicted nucleic acid-binding protein